VHNFSSLSIAGPSPRRCRCPLINMGNDIYSIKYQNSVLNYENLELKYSNKLKKTTISKGEK
jgi:hypothetical protein